MFIRLAISSFLVSILMCLPLQSFANANPDSTGLPGDHLDLTGVLEIFKKSKTLEEFEKKLNTKDNQVNNLDLNGDNKTDYIRVVDDMKDKIHVIILRVPIDAKESQDVAVIEIEKKGDKSAQLQIVGDEELYGEKYVVEPAQEKKDSPDGKWQEFSPQVVFVNVWYWPCVEYIYYPDYVIWVSPWYWSYWPYWWSPWHPYPYYVYYGWWYPYHVHYYYVHEYHIVEAHNYYGPRRVASTHVHQRYEAAHARHKEQIKNKSPQTTSPKEKGEPTIPKQKTEPALPKEKAEPVPPKPPKPNMEPAPPKEKAEPTPPKQKAEPAPPRPKTEPAPPRPKVEQQPSPRPKAQPQPAPRPKAQPPGPKGSKPRFWKRNKK